MSEPLISVVTPVYNTGEYIAEAIESVLRQTHRNFEYIICNNHSTDDTLAIAQSYAAQDARIKIVQPPTFLGQGKNFNFAIQQISRESRWLKMVLADDWLYPQSLAELSACGEANPNVGVVSSYRLNGAEGEGFGLPVEEIVISGRTACRFHLLNKMFLFGTPTTLLYRADVARSRSPRFFPDDRIFFDTEAAFQILEHHDFGFVHQILSYSRTQPGAITDRLRQFNDRKMDRLITLHEYGPRFLTADEHQRHYGRALRVFYEGLGREWLKERLEPRRKEFWDFQSRGLSTIGLELDSKLLAKGVRDSVVRTVGSPFDVIRELIVQRQSPDKA